MSYSVRILKDSMSPSGKRLTTWELTYPRFVHAEFMTHRLFSRNAASSRAIPIDKVLERIEMDPALPVWWGKNQAGMQAREELSTEDGTFTQNSSREEAEFQWTNSRFEAIKSVRRLQAIGLHKQISNRIVEPWMFITVIVSATEWDNWFWLRDHKEAQPEIAWVAKEMHKKYLENIPKVMAVGDWHLPLIGEEDWWETSKPENCGSSEEQVAMIKKISVGRCARVSYLTHEGKRDIREDVALHDKLIAGLKTNEPIHMSPFEHVATPMSTDEWNHWASHELKKAIMENRPFDQTVFGNFIGWQQYRKEIPNEHFRSPSSP